jgi:glucosamine--fructose-6-phosphate aminotransferase (isomerizing)
MTLREEIHEQPEVLEGLVGTTGPAAAEAAALLMRTDVAHVMIAARGTSDNAARYAKYTWGAIGGLPVALAAPSLYGGYASPPNLRSAAIVGISQSGQSPDLIAVLEEGKRQQRPTIAITNEPTSPLADLADVVVRLRAPVGSTSRMSRAPSPECSIWSPSSSQQPGTLARFVTV